MKKISFFSLIMIFVFVLPTTSLAGSEERLGTAATLLDAMSSPPATSAETALGDVTADAVRAFTGADLALVPARSFNANIQPGDVYEADIRYALPYDENYSVIDITPAQLHSIMEQALSSITLTDSYAIDHDASVSGDFLQIAGFSVQYDPNMPASRRVHTLTINGIEYSALDTTPVFTAAMPYSLAAAYSSAAVSLDLTPADAVTAYFRSEVTVSAPDSDRIHAIAVRDNDYIHRFPIVLLCFAAIAVIVCSKGLLHMHATSSASDRRHR